MLGCAQPFPALASAPTDGSAPRRLPALRALRTGPAGSQLMFGLFTDLLNNTHEGGPGAEMLCDRKYFHPVDPTRARRPPNPRDQEGAMLDCAALARATRIPAGPMRPLMLLSAENSLLLPATRCDRQSAETGAEKEKRCGFGHLCGARRE